MQLAPQTLAALKTDLARAASAWRVTAVNVATHEKTSAGAGDPPAPITVLYRHIAMTISSAPRGEALVFFLEGPAAGAIEECALNWRGNTFTTTDAPLIASLMSKITPFETGANAAMRELFTSTPPAPEVA